MASAGQRKTPLLVTVGLIVLGAVLIIVGAIYITQTAGHLPSFFPGYKARSLHHHHIKRGVLAVALGVVAFVGAWMSVGRKSVSSSEPAEG